MSGEVITPHEPGKVYQIFPRSCRGYKGPFPVFGVVLESQPDEERQSYTYTMAVPRVSLKCPGREPNGFNIECNVSHSGLRPMMHPRFSYGKYHPNDAAPESDGLPSLLLRTLASAENKDIPVARLIAYRDPTKGWVVKKLSGEEFWQFKGPKDPYWQGSYTDPPATTMVQSE